MNDTTQKIVAEAAKKLTDEHPAIMWSVPANKLLEAFQSAIEKAYNAGLAKGYWKRNAEIVSAAHASEDYASEDEPTPPAFKQSSPP